MNKPTVNEYISKQKTPQKEICENLRVIILKTFPNIKEEMKLGAIWYADGKYYIVALKTHVNLGFKLENMPKTETSKLQGSGKTMRCLQFANLTEINKKEIIRMLKLI